MARLLDVDTGSFVTVSSASASSVQRAKVERGRFRKKRINSHLIILDVDDVLSEYGCAQIVDNPVERVINYYATRSVFIICVMSDQSASFVEHFITDSIDIITVPANHVTAAITQKAVDAHCPIISNREIKHNLIKALPQLLVRYTFSLRGVFCPLADIDDMVSCPGSEPCTSTSTESCVCHMLADFDGRQYGADYLTLYKDDEVVCDCAREGWTWVHIPGASSAGWVPTNFLSRSQHASENCARHEPDNSTNHNFVGSGVEWKQYGGKWWRVSPDGKWVGIDGTTLHPPAANEPVQVDRFHVPNLGYGDLVWDHLEELHAQLEAYGLKLVDSFPKKRDIMSLPQLLNAIEEEVEEPQEVTPWYLVWADIEGSQSDLIHLRKGRLRIQISQPEGDPIDLKFLKHKRKKKDAGPPRVAIPRTWARAEASSDSQSSSNEACASCRSLQVFSSSSCTTPPTSAMLPLSETSALALPPP